MQLVEKIFPRNEVLGFRYYIEKVLEYVIHSNLMYILKEICYT